MLIKTFSGKNWFSRILLPSIFVFGIYYTSDSLCTGLFLFLPFYWMIGINENYIRVYDDRLEFGNKMLFWLKKSTFYFTDIFKVQFRRCNKGDLLTIFSTQDNFFGISFNAGSNLFVDDVLELGEILKAKGIEFEVKNEQTF